jgi:hypothetical protein
MLKMLLIAFFELLLKYPQDAREPLANIVPFTKLFYGARFSLYYQHGQHEEGSPLLNHVHAQGKVTLMRSFICFSPLLNIFRNHYVSL